TATRVEAQRIHPGPARIGERQRQVRWTIDMADDDVNILVEFAIAVARTLDVLPDEPAVRPSAGAGRSVGAAADPSTTSTAHSFGARQREAGDHLVVRCRHAIGSHGRLEAGKPDGDQDRQYGNRHQKLDQRNSVAALGHVHPPLGRYSLAPPPLAGKPRRTSGRIMTLSVTIGEHPPRGM